MDKSAEKSEELFNSGYYWAESVILAVAGKTDIDTALLTRLASGFCSGMARTSGMCGAVTGGMLALNLALGRKDQTDSIEKNYDAIQELINRFESRFTSTNCSELLSCDLGTEEGRKKFKEEELINKCREFTSKAAGITAEILDEVNKVG